MSLTPSDLKNQGNQYYSNHQSSFAIESYSQAIQLIENNSHDDVPLYLLYSNRSAAHIQDKNFYDGYEDAKQSLKLQKNENSKGFYRLSVCSYHLGYLEEAKKLIREAIDEHKQNIGDYHQLKLRIEEKEKCMKKWRKPTSTVKKGLKNLEQIICRGVLWMEIPSILYQIRYVLRSYFEKTEDKKLLNINHGDLGLKLHELAVQFNGLYNVERIIMSDPIFEDLILNEMPDVGSLRIKSYEQRKLPRDQRDYDLEDKASNDLTAYEFSFFINNVLASLVANARDPHVSLCALRQLHRFTKNDLYRQSLGDALSDAINNYIYRQYENVPLVEKFLDKYGIEILTFDYLEASCELSALRMLKQITVCQWKKQSPSTIRLVIKQMSKKIRQKGIDLIEPNKLIGGLSSEMKKMMSNLNPNEDEDEKKDLNLIVNVLTKLHFIFGQQPFLDRSIYDPFFFYVKQTWFNEINLDNSNSKMISFLLNGWKSILIQWLKLDYQTRRQYSQQINTDRLHEEDDD